MEGILLNLGKEFNYKRRQCRGQDPFTEEPVPSGIIFAITLKNTTIGKHRRGRCWLLFSLHFLFNVLDLLNSLHASVLLFLPRGNQSAPHATDLYHFDLRGLHPPVAPVPQFFLIRQSR